MATVLITGGSGLVEQLHEKLSEKGCEVLILSRNKSQLRSSNVFY